MLRYHIGTKLLFNRNWLVILIVVEHSDRFWRKSINTCWAFQQGGIEIWIPVTTANMEADNASIPVARAHTKVDNLSIPVATGNMKVDNLSILVEGFAHA